MARVIIIDGRMHKFPDDATDDEIREVLATRGAGQVVAPAEGWQIKADVQSERDGRAIEAIREELALDPNNRSLQRDLAFAEKRAATVVPKYGATPNPTTPVAESARASQADVRASESAEAPRDTAAKQAERQSLIDTKERLAQRWRDATGGALKPGQTVDQAIAAMFPGYAALDERIAKTGVGSTGASTGGLLGGLGGTLGGAVLGGATAGPPGAVVGGILGSLGGSTAGTAIGTWADLRSGETITDAEAEALMRDRLIENAVWDVGGNLLFFGGGKSVRWLANTPKGKALLARYGASIKPSGLPTRAEGLASEHTRAVGALTEGQDATTKAAVEDLSRRAEGGYIPTAGQISGRPQAMEEVRRAFQPDEYARQQEALVDAAKQSREEIVAPIFSTPNATGKELGERINVALDNVEAKVKARTRPVFDKARAQNFRADATGVRAEAVAELERNRLSANANLHAGERAYLESLVKEETSAQPLVLGPTGAPMTSAPATYVFPLDDPGGILDFISANKAKMREMTTEGAPTEGFKTVLTNINKQAEAAYELAARKAGKGGVYKDLTEARDAYRDMMSTVYDTAMKKAMKAEPEKVGEMIATKGNVSQIEELDRMLALAEKEGAIDGLERGLLRNEVVKGFLGKQIDTIEKAAKWSDSLAKDRALKNTWTALTRDVSTGTTQELVKLLERQSQIALKDIPARANATALRFGSPLGAAAAGWWMGAFPGMAIGAAGGLSISALMKLSAMAEVKGSGVLARDVALAIRSTTPGFAGGRTAVEALKRLNEAAKANGIDLIQTEAPQPTQEQ